ncbi:hypothetical protein [Novosphingobium colocasiae]|uniref:hypothetical protein n=1 Tax=Novosphingobium colocasiae TaxID=1256513 RepID=UPI0035B089AE
MLLIWALFPAALLTICGLLLVLIIAIFRKVRPGRPRMGWSTAGPLLGCTTLPLFILLSVLVGLPWLYSVRSAASDFTEAFGERPSESFTNLKGQTETGLDSRTIFLTFDDNAATSALLERKFDGSARVEETDLLNGEIFADSAPAWFSGASSVVGTPCQGREAVEFHDWREWDSVVVVKCPRARRIYALFSSID